MKRKTNLFYNSDSQDSNFLTFSNYTESMTGNFLATDNKLYPSSFLCLNIPRLYDSDSAINDYNEVIQKNQEYIKKVINDISVDDMKFVVTTGPIYLNINGNEVSYPEGDTIPTNVIKHVDGTTDFNVSDINDIVLEIIKGNKDSHINSFIYNTTDNERVDIVIKDSKDVTIYDSLNNYTITIDDATSKTIRLVTCTLTTLDISTLPDYKEIDNPDDLSSTQVYQANKREFMQAYLCAHYENKLAYLRDYYTNSDKLVESNILPLNYLIETIYEYDPSTTIEYVGDVTEQDYNGTFTDTICVVDSSKYYRGSVVEQSSTSSNAINIYKESSSYLYGWSSRKQDYNPNYDFNKDGEISLSISMSSNNALFDSSYHPEFKYIRETLRSTYNIQEDTDDDYNTYILKFHKKKDYLMDVDNYLKTLDKIITYAKIYDQYNGPSIYANTKPLYDGYDNTSYTYYYNSSSNLSYISLELVPEPSNTSDAINELSFNVIIPLYDMVDNNYNTNNRIVSELSYIPLQNKSTSSLENQEMYVQYVPLGIWFSGTDYVTLKRDPIAQYSTTWSLCLSSQFKPFPYSTYMPSEITNTTKSDAFMTFAQILTRQNDLIDSMSDINRNLIDMSQRLSLLEKKVSSLGTTYNLDNFEYEINNFKNEVNNKIINIENQISETQLQWVNKEG